MDILGTAVYLFILICMSAPLFVGFYGLFKGEQIRDDLKEIYNLLQEIKNNKN